MHSKPTLVSEKREHTSLPVNVADLSARFIGTLVGVDSSRLLLGREDASEAEQLERAAEAAADLISQLEARP
jgi:hypothetical protein